MFSRVSLFYEAYSLVTFYCSLRFAPVHVYGQPGLSFPLSRTAATFPVYQFLSGDLFIRAGKVW